MRNILVVLALFTAGALFIVTTNSANAAPVWSLTLTSSDAGQTNTGTINGNTTYVIEGDIPFCFRTGTSTLAVDCAKDSVVNDTKNGVSTVVQADGGTSSSTTMSALQVAEFESGSHTKIAAKALDGGNPNVRVLTVVKNKAQ